MCTLQYYAAYYTTSRYYNVVNFAYSERTGDSSSVGGQGKTGNVECPPEAQEAESTDTEEFECSAPAFASSVLVECRESSGDLYS